MARFWFDLDGVLADFDAGFVAAFGMTPRAFTELHGERVFWKRISETPRFYLELPWCEGAAEMLEVCRSMALSNDDAPMILTGLPLGEWAAPQKRAWVLREAPSMPIVTCMSRDKPIYCNTGDVLIDDREEAGIGWREAGGIFIHHTDPASTIAAVRAHYGE